MNNHLIAFFIIGFLLVAVVVSDIIVLTILEFYYSTLKRARLYCQVKKERKKVLKEPDTAI